MTRGDVTGGDVTGGGMARQHMARGGCGIQPATFM
jgi:hypothetical protein